MLSRPHLASSRSLRLARRISCVILSIAVAASCSSSKSSLGSDAAENDRRICQAAEQIPIQAELVEALANHGPSSPIATYASSAAAEWKDAAARRDVHAAGDAWSGLIDFCVSHGY
jgi:hypothetical protein